VAKKEWDDGFACGVASVISFLYTWGEKQHAEESLKETGMSYEDFKRSGVEESDLGIIKELLKEDN